MQLQRDAKTLYKKKKGTRSISLVIYDSCIWWTPNSILHNDPDFARNAKLIETDDCLDETVYIKYTNTCTQYGS